MIASGASTRPAVALDTGLERLAAAVESGEVPDCRLPETERELLRRTNLSRYRYGKDWASRLEASARHSRRIICISPHVASEAVRLLGVPEDLIEVIPNGVDTDLFDRSALTRDARLKLLRHWLVDDPQGWDESGHPGSIRYPLQALDAFTSRGGEPLPLLLFVGRYLGFEARPAPRASLRSGAATLRDPGAALDLGPGDLVGRPVVQAAVGPVVVAVDVAADAAAGVVEGFVFVQPHLSFFEFPEPALDEGLALGVAVAAAAVTDPELGELCAEAAGGEGRAVVAPEHELARLDPVDRGGSLDDRDRFVGAAAQRELPADDLAGAAVDDRVQIAPAVLGDPDRGHVELPQLPRPLDPEEAGPLAALQGRRRWISFRSRITRSTRLRLTGRPSFRRTNAATIR